MRIMRNAAVGAALTFVGFAALIAQQPPEQRQPPTFRVEVNYVEIDATVTDAPGNFVRGLTKDDFELVEEGQPQTISAFTMVDLPAARPDPPLFRGAVVEPDVRTNIGEFDGRVMLLVLDDLQTDFRRSLLVRAAARQFVRRFVGVNDLVAIVTTGGSTRATQDFTNSQSRLLAAIDRFSGQKPRRGQTAADRLSELELVTKAENSLRALSATADFLGNIRGRRKAVVWFSEGIEYDIENPMNTYTAQLLDDMRVTIGSATRSGVAFYAVDPRGVGAGLDEAIEVTLDAEFQNESGMSGAMNATRRAQNFLRTMSSETGGFAVVNQNNLNEAFAKIIQENSSYYLLGYYPTNDRRDGKFRKVMVRVKRPGLQVKSRMGYTAPRGKPPTRETNSSSTSAPPDLRAALDSPMPVNGLGMRVFAAAFAGPPKKGSIAIIVEFDPSRLRFQPAAGGAYAEDLELIILPVNASGKPLDGARDKAPLRLGQRTYELARSNGLRMVRRLDLPVGRYQLHVAAKASNGNAVGGLAYDLDVPDFSKPALAMSGLTLMATSAARMLTPPPDKEFNDVLPVPATALRDFPAGDTLSLYTEVYDNKAGTPHAVEIRTSVTADDGKVVFTAADQRRTQEINAKSGGFGHMVKIPLTDYPPGRYVLRVDARATTSDGASAARELEFRVR
jgi:VWFA-related protein